MSNLKQVCVLALAVVLLGGCTLSYTLGVNDAPASTATAATAADKSAKTAGAAATPTTAAATKPGERIESPEDLHALGPVDAAIPRNPADAGDAQFTTPQASTETPVATGNPRSAGPLNLFGDLPDGSANPSSSPLDSPGQLEQITFLTEGADFDPQVDPTGKFLAFASTRHREQADIYIQKIGGTTVTQLTNDPARDIMPAFSPDGAQIAFASNRSGNWDIYLMEASGGKAQQITNNGTHDLHPSFSPDGKKLVYCSYGDKSGQWELVVIDLANPANRQIIGHGLFPSWSPKGDRIVFQRARERGTRWFSVWTIDLVDGEARRATEIVAANNAAAITPRWSPDGQFIVFSTVVNPDKSKADRPTQADVWVIGADGSGRANLTNSKFANLQPVWSKNGSIYFVSNRGKDNVETVWSLKPEQALKVVKSNAKPPTAVADPAVPAKGTSEKDAATAAVETKE